MGKIQERIQMVDKLKSAGLSFTVFGAIVAATWTVASFVYDNSIKTLELTIANYEKSANWQLPQVLDSIRIASSELSKDLKIHSEHRLLKASLDSLRKANSQLNEKILITEGELSKTKEDLKEKTELLMELNAKNIKFRLQENKSKTLTGYDLVVAVTHLSIGKAEVNVNSRTQEVKTGSVISLMISGNKCRLVVDEIHWEALGAKYVDFTFLVVSEED